MPKRPVAIYRHNLLPLSETFIANHAASLRRYEPYLFGVKREAGAALISNFSSVTFAGDGNLARLQELGVRYFHYYGKLCSHVKKIAPALIHAHFGTDGAEIMSMAASLKLPLIVTLHGFDVTMTDQSFAKSRSGRLYLRQRPQLWRETSLFICVSESIRQYAIKRGFPAEKLWVHYLGIDLEQFRADPQCDRERIVLFVARLVEKKGCIYLIRAMELVQRTMPDVQLVIIGDGPERQRLQEAAKSTLRNYEFLGAQPTDIVRHWMNKSKVFCVPSISAESGDSEGLPVTLCEAQAMGVPVVSFSGGGVDEAVSNGTSGLLAAQKDVASLANHIMAFLDDRRFWEQASVAGRSHAQKLFDLSAQTAILEQRYDEFAV